MPVSKLTIDNLAVKYVINHLPWLYPTLVAKDILYDILKVYSLRRRVSSF